MIARRTSLVALAIAASLAWTGCQPVVQPPAGQPKAAPQTQGKASPKIKQVKVDDDTILLGLLMTAAVQQDLALTAEQMRTIKDIAKASAERSRQFEARLGDTFPNSRSLSPEESEARERKLRQWIEDWKAGSKELQTKALAVLTPSQSDRLKQSQLQRSLPATLARREIAKALGLSAEQLEKLRAIGDRPAPKLPPELFDLHFADSTEGRQKVIAFQKECERARAESSKRVWDVLTPEQRAKLEKLLGKRIEITWPEDVLIPEDAAS